MSREIRDTALNVFVYALSGGLLLFLVLDWLHYHVLAPEVDAILILLEATIILLILLYIVAVKNSYLVRSLDRILTLQEDLGITSYVSDYVSRLRSNNYGTMQEAYRALDLHLREGAYFPVPKRDNVSVIDAIFRTGEKHCISMAAAHPQLLRRLVIAYASMNCRVLLARNVFDQLDEHAREVFRAWDAGSASKWRTGPSLDVVNVILAIEVRNGVDVAVRAVKYEIAPSGDISSFVTTDKETLRFWMDYFSAEFEKRTEEILSPLKVREGVEAVRTGALFVCSNFPDLIPRMQELLEEGKAERAVVHAVAALRTSGVASEGCRVRHCEVCSPWPGTIGNTASGGSA
jgi:hypothetical protein